MSTGGFPLFLSPPPPHLSLAFQRRRRRMTCCERFSPPPTRPKMGAKRESGGKEEKNTEVVLIFVSAGSLRVLISNGAQGGHASKKKEASNRTVAVRARSAPKKLLRFFLPPSPLGGDNIGATTFYPLDSLPPSLFLPSSSAMRQLFCAFQREGESVPIKNPPFFFFGPCTYKWETGVLLVCGRKRERGGGGDGVAAFCL